MRYTFYDPHAQYENQCSVDMLTTEDSYGMPETKPMGDKLPKILAVVAIASIALTIVLLSVGFFSYNGNTSDNSAADNDPLSVSTSDTLNG